MKDLHEASMNFDLEDLEPFVRAMADKLDGFGSPDVDKVVAGVRSMAVDAEAEWRFSVRRDGRTVPLVVRVFLDDVDAPDLHLFSDAALAGELQADLMAFAERLGK